MVHSCCHKWQYLILFMAEQYSVPHPHTHTHPHIFFIHSSVNGHLGCFHVLVFVNSDAVKIGVPVSFQIRVFVFSGYVPRSEIAGSYDNSIFSFLQNLVFNLTFSSK